MEELIVQGKTSIKTLNTKNHYLTKGNHKGLPLWADEFFMMGFLK